MEIRNAAPSDADALARIHRAARRQAMPWLPVLHSPQEDLQFFATRVLATEEVWISCDDTRPLGFLSRKENWVTHLYVDPAHWRRGIGTALLASAQASSDALQLWTFQRNHPARRFYAAHGFEEVAFTDGTANEEQTPDVRMRWMRRPSEAAPQP